MKRRFLVTALAVLFLGLGTIATTGAQEMKFFRIGTGGAGGTYFPIGGLIANAVSNPPGSRPCDKGGSCGVPGLVAIAVSTNASVANVNAIQAGQLDAGLAGAQSVTQADEAVWVGCVRDLQEGGSPLGIDRPVLIGVGQVFASVRAASIFADADAPIPYQSSVS